MSLSVVWFTVLVGQFLVPPPDIAVPIGKPMAVRTERYFFLLDPSEMQVYQYTLAGKKVRVFGGKGQGPGHFVQAHRLTWQANRLIVHDLHSVHLYNEDGAFLEMKKNPYLVLPRKVANGWVGLKGLLHQTELQFLHFNEDFSKVTPIASWDVPGTPTLTTLNFIQDHDRLVVTANGRLAFVKPRYSGTIWRYEVSNGDLTPLTPHLPPILFDRDYGDRQSESRNKSRRALGLPTMKYDYPDAFPPILYIQPTVKGNLLIDRWYDFESEGAISARKKIEKGLQRYIDQNGNPIDPDPGEWRPILVVAEDPLWVYHVAYDQDTETSTLVRVPSSEAEESLEQAMQNQICVICKPDEESP